MDQKPLEIVNAGYPVNTFHDDFGQGMFRIVRTLNGVPTDDDLVGVDHRRESMGDHQGGVIFGDLREGFLDQLLRAAGLHHGLPDGRTDGGEPARRASTPYRR